MKKFEKNSLKNDEWRPFSEYCQQHKASNIHLSPFMWYEQDKSMLYQPTHSAYAVLTHKKALLAGGEGVFASKLLF